MKLAIVVPAYKPQFLKLALDSIANQDCHNFECYIFDDAGPSQIKEIAGDFPAFHYKRFEQNRGGIDLVAHWNRCLQEITEEWVWLFSDDDIMELNCASAFYKALEQNPQCTVFRFDLDQIDSDGNKFYSWQTTDQTSLEFLVSRLKREQTSALPDHIFNRKKLLDLNGGLINFPLAWNSDDATWCLLGKTYGIIAIHSARVYWRQSEFNISNQTHNGKQKVLADRLFYLWCCKNFDLTISLKFLFMRWLSRRRTSLGLWAWLQQGCWKSPAFGLSILLAICRKCVNIIKH